MKVERERKWLLKRLPALDWEKKMNIIQFYDREGIRYRMTCGTKEKPVYERIKKVRVDIGINHETDVEYIEWAEFWEIRRARDPDNKMEISKTRHVFTYKDKVFEVDVFEDIQLIVLEVEDVSTEDEIPMPKQIMDQVIVEVTGVEAFSNYNLAKKSND